MNFTSSSPSTRAAVARVATGAVASVFAATLAAIALAPAGMASPAAHASRTQKLSLRHTSVGKVLVDSSGFTVFRFSKDTGRKNTCMADRECNATWPALTTTGRPQAGPGVKSSLLSTITIRGGAHQVTYAGHPLYRYAVASERGETSYIGVRQFGGTWSGVSASGANVR
jgi:predicted lipoprotein with Yx(FWY)xxD motif